MLRKRTWVETLVSDTARFSFSSSDRVVAVRVKNQGTATIITGWDSESKPNQIPAGNSDLFDVGDSGYTEGQLNIAFSGAGTKICLVTVLKDSPDNC